jgi:biofilm PGA synthesis N-glycosyltransferase PgaC
MITFIISVFTFLSTFFSAFHLLSSFRYRRKTLKTDGTNHKFSIVIPCYNEARIIAITINGLLRLDYEHFEVIFINDGSTDDTLEVLIKQLDLARYDGDEYNRIKGINTIYQSQKHGFIYVIDKNNGGKADSLNKGIRFAHNELIVTMDGDCILDKDALIVMNRVFNDPDVIASGGAVRVMQYFLLDRKTKPVIALQTLDFIKGFYIYKASLAYNNALNIISGAFGVFRRAALEAVNGFRNGLGEDIDITIRLQEYALYNNKSITYDTGAVCYTECPETWKDLTRQRVRWQKAFWDAVIQNRKFLFGKLFASNLCFLMLIDASFSGSMAVFSFIFNCLLISLRVIYGFPPFFALLAILALIFNVVSSIIGIMHAKQMTPRGLDKSPKYSLKFFILSIITDIFWFSVLRIFYFLKGSISYAMNDRNWDKIERTQNRYIILDK